MAKRALSSFPGALGNAFVLLRCQPDPLCHKESPAQQLEELSSLGMGMELILCSGEPRAALGAGSPPGHLWCDSSQCSSRGLTGSINTI